MNIFKVKSDIERGIVFDELISGGFINKIHNNDSNREYFIKCTRVGIDVIEEFSNLIDAFNIKHNIQEVNLLRANRDFLIDKIYGAKSNI